MDRRSLSFPMKFKDKADFLNTSEKEWKQFLSLLEGLTEPELLENGVWGENWNIRDMMAHIHEWHNMVLKWHSEGQKGSVEMPAPGYKWSETPRLNHDIYEEYRSLPHAEAEKRMKATHAKLRKLAESLTEKQLLEPAQFAWCGKNAITTYLAAAIISHYRWGQKKIKDWQKSSGKSPRSGAGGKVNSIKAKSNKKTSKKSPKKTSKKTSKK
ncbi:MAG: ClbS/DfsB family four-helix bundle protein [Leptospiraceae bacterium]|nr:ClbS/DfsB family four-helix bundle protein [Leptospiraceae bacterium]